MPTNYIVWKIGSIPNFGLFPCSFFLFLFHLGGGPYLSLLEISPIKAHNVFDCSRKKKILGFWFFIDFWAYGDEMTLVLPHHIQPIWAFNLLFHFQWDYDNLINHKITEHKITAIMISGCVTISQIGITLFLVNNGMIKINGVWNLGCKVWMKWPKWFVVY